MVESAKPHLEPCPFCGSQMESFAGLTPDAFAKCKDGFSGDATGFSVNCDCGVIGPTAKTMEAAVSAWNVRS
jgi:Lar family restriction alleviation protein